MATEDQERTALETELIAALKAINRTIYAVGAPLGSDRYFVIRETVVNALLNAGEREVM